jgi:hypothetical protein
MARRTGIFSNPLLTESSGLAASRRQPGVLWSLNDSGNEPFIFATDTAGTDLGTFRVRGSRNVDWEEISLGPCGRAQCLYIADTGDNRERRRSVALYRIPEPDLPSRHPHRLRETAPADVLEFRYPDGPHDVEAIWVDTTGAVHLVTKGRSHGARHFRLPAAAWTSAQPVVAERLDSLPIPVDAWLHRLVTAASPSPDGRWVAIRTYGEIYFFVPTDAGPLGLPSDPVACNVQGLELQGEGLAWLDDSRLILGSERAFLRAGTLTEVRCQRPLAQHQQPS